MTAVSLGTSFEWPAQSGGFASADSALAFNEATADYIAFVLKAPATGTIDKAHLRIGTSTLVGTISCQVQTLDASGDPSGTAYGSCTQIDITNPAASTTHSFSGLACSATMGDHIAVKFWCSAFTSGSANAQYSGTTAVTGLRAIPYVTTRTTGAGAGTHAQCGGGMTLEYSGATYYDIDLQPTCTQGAESVDSDGAVRRIGNRFTVPAAITVDGVWTVLDWDTDTTTVKLYDTDGTTVLGTSTLLTANRQSTSGSFVRAKFDGGAVNLTANTASPYRVVVETNNTSATAATIRVISNITTAHMAQMAGGTAWYYTSHNGTAWSDTNTKRAAIGLLVSKIDDGFGFGDAYCQVGI